MSLLSYKQIAQLLEAGVVVGTSCADNINSASLDITLGRFILVEARPQLPIEGYMPKILSLRQRDPLTTTKIDLGDTGCFRLQPGQFILAQSEEVFNLPNNISAEYKLKSSMARIGLEHLNAGWCDAGWHGSVLTLEFRNLTTFHEIELRRGDKIGQMVFFSHDEVPAPNSYATRGSYNGDTTTVSAKPICESCES